MTWSSAGILTGTGDLTFDFLALTIARHNHVQSSGDGIKCRSALLVLMLVRANFEIKKIALFVLLNTCSPLLRLKSKQNREVLLYWPRCWVGFKSVSLQ